MADHHSDPLQHAELNQGTTLRYIIAFVASFGALVVAFYVAQQKLAPLQLFTELATALLVSLLVQAGLFFGLDLSRAQIWKSISLVLTVPLFLVTIGFTVWVFSSLYGRTMPDPAIMSAMSM
jgi:cytochrome o ubiquinol oxidase operon protein cyoD